jgi:hypothetical protein
MGSTEDSSKTEGHADEKPEPKPDAAQAETAQPDASQDDRRAQSRTETILSEIEDATYKVLRKHQDKKAE